VLALSTLFLGFSKTYSGTIAVTLISFFGSKISSPIRAFSMVDILISSPVSGGLTAN
jgi:hypothetical protein